MTYKFLNFQYYPYNQLHAYRTTLNTLPAALQSRRLGSIQQIAACTISSSPLAATGTSRQVLAPTDARPRPTSTPTLCSIPCKKTNKQRGKGNVNMLPQFQRDCKSWEARSKDIGLHCIDRLAATRFSLLVIQFSAPKKFDPSISAVSGVSS